MKNPDKLDHTIEETFPASDPPSTLPNPDDDALIEDAPILPPEPEVRSARSVA